MKRIKRIRTAAIAVSGFFVSIMAVIEVESDYMLYGASEAVLGWLIIWMVLTVVSEYRIMHIGENEEKIYRLAAAGLPLAYAVMSIYIMLSGHYESLISAMIINNAFLGTTVSVLFLLSVTDINSDKHRMTRYCYMPVISVLMIADTFFGMYWVWVSRGMYDRFIVARYIQQLLLPLYMMSLSGDSAPEDHMIREKIQDAHHWLFDLEGEE